MLLIVALLGVCGLSLAQISDDCMTQMDSMHTCMVGALGGPEGVAALEEKITSTMENMQATFQSHMPIVAGCLTKNGCSDPTPMLQKKLAQKEFKSCNMDSFETIIKPVLDSCTGLEMPNVKLLMGLKGKKGKKGGMKGKMMKEMQKMIKSACPKGSNPMPIFGCIMQEAGPPPQPDVDEEQMKGVMQAVGKCAKGFFGSAQGRACMGEAKDAMCGCAESQIINNDNVRAQLEEACPLPDGAKEDPIDKMYERFCVNGDDDFGSDEDDDE